MADQKKDPTLRAENPYQFAAKRLSEMSSLLTVLRAPKQTKLVFQTLPKHMRRRAATHNPKRLPRRLRGTHLSQFKKSGVPVKTKRPTRKYRRKPASLREEYARRTASHKPLWLETHLWHAKRFHMVTRWGFRLPLSPCDKSYRACYRATTKYCLMQDVSYLATVQLSGTLEALQTGLRSITSPKCGLTLNARCLLDGKREGDTYLFEANRYPLGCIGKVTFFWLPRESHSSQASIYLTVHPAILTKVNQELREVFQLQPIDANTDRSEQIEMRNMQGAFNRFRLAGPLAHSVVTSAFRGATVRGRSDVPLHAHLSGQELVQETQQRFWNTLQHCDNVQQLPSRMILSVVIEDPRLNRPIGKVNHSDRHVSQATTVPDVIPEHLNESALFRRDIMETVAANVMTTGQYAKARNASSVVPGQRCDFEEQLQVVPILLIQRPGEQSNTRLGFNSGWDVVVPKGYGSIVWLSLIMWGARAGGLREAMSTQRESRMNGFMPDTEAGQAEAKSTMVSARATFFKRPCNKRPNYMKLAIASPFLSPWRQLVREWEGDSDRFFVLRDRIALEQVQLYLSGKTNSLPINLENQANMLVPIVFTMTGRGRPGPNSIICLPDPSDSLSSEGPIYTEPPGRDLFETSRKKCRSDHLRVLARMRRKRVKAKRVLQLRSTRKSTIAPPLTEQLIADQHKKMCEMWLPSTWQSIRRQCSRETIGYCAAADFSFVDAKSCGTGYVTFSGLTKVLPRAKTHALIRDPASRQYRGATLGVALN